MFVLVWRGWGFIVPLFAILGIVVGAGVGSLLGQGKDTPVADAVCFLICGVVAGAGIWLTAKKIEARPGRVMIDKASGREFKVGANAGSMFAVPTRYWAFIMLGLGLLCACAHMISAFHLS